MAQRSQTVTRPGMADSVSDVVLFVTIAAVAVIGVAAWLTGQAAGLLFDQAWPSVSFAGALSAVAHLPGHLTDPRQAWPAAARPDLPGLPGFIVTGVLVLGLLGAGLTLGAREWVRHQPQKGFASRSQIMQSLSGQAVIKRGAAVRPGLKGTKIQVTDVGVWIGHAIASGIRIALSAEESLLLAAAARAGKTAQFIISALAFWSGPAFVTSLRPDVLLATAGIRRKKGPVRVMAPTGAIDWPDKMRWDLTSGCEDFTRARTRAGVMVTVGKGPGDSTNEGFFSQSATNLLAGWLHAARLSGGSANDVLRWAFDERLDEPVRLLGAHPRAAPGTAAMLDSLYRQPAESTRASLWATAQTAVAPLLSEDARAVFTPPPGESVDLEEFLKARGTCYLIVSDRQATALAPVITAFVDELIETHKAMADRRPGGRPENLLGLFLDEVCNITPLPQLPALMSFSGGSGIFIAAVVQNRAQARSRWGAEGADMLWGASTAKLFLGGLSGPELDDISKLAGEYREAVTTWQRGHGGHSMSTTLQDRRTMTPDQVRTLSTLEREALLIHGSTPAVKIRMTRYYEGADRDLYAASEAESRRLAGLDPAMPGPVVPAQRAEATPAVTDLANRGMRSRGSTGSRTKRQMWRRRR